jgi:DNA-binding response OmpR family regulator
VRILIAEDDPISRCMLEATLKKWGYDVIMTSNGREAWQSLQQDDPQLAILDWMMPGLDGAQVCCKVREASPRGRIYIILLTAKVEKDDVVAVLEAGADDYVTKPLDRAELRARQRWSSYSRTAAEPVRACERANGCAFSSQPTARNLAHLLPLPKSSQRSILLATGRRLHQRALGGPIRSQRVHGMLRDDREA